MPTRFLPDAEIARLESFPESIERRDLVRCFSLTGQDLAFVRGQRGAPNQLGIALQLGSLRWLGFIPEDLPGAPAEALALLGDVLDVAPREIFDYAVRAPTRAEQRVLVRAHAGFRAFTEGELDRLRARLVDLALEHERPSLLRPPAHPRPASRAGALPLDRRQRDHRVNTVYTGRVLDELRAAGELIITSETERISPLAHQHLHLYGHYPFDLVTRPAGHRPLRAPAAAPTPAPKTPNRV